MLSSQEEDDEIGDFQENFDDESAESSEHKSGDEDGFERRRQRIRRRLLSRQRLGVHPLRRPFRHRR